MFDTKDEKTNPSSWASDLFDVDYFLGRHAREKDTSKFLVLFRFLNSMMLFSSAYLGVGIFITTLEAGAEFGYELLWVVFFSTVMSFGFQLLATKLALGTEGNIMENSIDEHPSGVSFAIWVLIMINILGSQVVQLAGAAVGLKMITGLPVMYCCLVLLLDVIPYTCRGSSRFTKLEILVGYTTLVVGVFIFSNAFTVHPAAEDVARGFVPDFSQRSIYVAISLIGSTISPHSLYFQSYIITTKNYDRVESKIKKMYLSNVFESFFAWIGYFILATVCVIVSASTYYDGGDISHCCVEDVSVLLEGHYKEHAAKVIMGVILVFTSETTMSRLTVTSSVIAKNMISRSPKPWIHHLSLRAMSIVPVIVVDNLSPDSGLFKLVIFCQVISTVILPVVLVQILKTTSSRSKMQGHANGLPVALLSFCVICILVFANIYMIYEETYFTTENMNKDTRNFLFFAIAVAVVVYLLLLVFLMFYDVQWVMEYIFCQKFVRRGPHHAYQPRKVRTGSSRFVVLAEDEGDELLSRRGDL